MPETSHPIPPDDNTPEHLLPEADTPDNTSPNGNAPDTRSPEADTPDDNPPNGNAPDQHSGENSRELRGLYRHVKISIRTLDIIIVAGLLAIVLLVLWSASGDGYLVRFDSRGGSDVPSQTVRYGETVAEPDAPERTGYTFGGWYLDEGGSIPWDFPNTRVEGELTLFALWIPDS